ETTGVLNPTDHGDRRQGDTGTIRPPRCRNKARHFPIPPTYVVTCCVAGRQELDLKPQSPVAEVRPVPGRRGAYELHGHARVRPWADGRRLDQAKCARLDYLSEIIDPADNALVRFGSNEPTIEAVPAGWLTSHLMILNEVLHRGGFRLSSNIGR